MIIATVTSESPLYIGGTKIRTKLFLPLGATVEFSHKMGNIICIKAPQYAVANAVRSYISKYSLETEPLGHYMLQMKNPAAFFQALADPILGGALREELHKKSIVGPLDSVLYAKLEAQWIVRLSGIPKAKKIVEKYDFMNPLSCPKISIENAEIIMKLLDKPYVEADLQNARLIRSAWDSSKTGQTVIYLPEAPLNDFTVVGEDQYTLNSIILQEQFVAQFISECSNAPMPVSLEAENTLTDTQKKICDCLILQGFGGTGKSYTIAKLCRQMLEKGILFYCVAFTGKAVETLRHAVELEIGKTEAVQTIHKFMFRRANIQVLIIDEASMVTGRLLYKLFSKIKSRPRLIFSGDIMQLQPFGNWGRPFLDLWRRGLGVVNLTEVKRNTTDLAPEIVQYRNGLISTTAEFKSKNFRCGPFDLETIIGHYGILLGKLGGDHMRIQIITATNALAEIINTRIGPRIGIGAKIMFLKNTKYSLNGQMGICTSHNNSKYYIGESYSYADQTTLGYAITCHKAQGSEWPIVMICIPRASMLDHRWLYTAMSRSSKHVMLYCSDMAFKQISENRIEEPPDNFSRFI
jgi:hypothetical protein